MKRFLGCLLLLSVLLMSMAFSEGQEGALPPYDRIDMGMTKEAIEALAPLTQEGEYLLFSGEVLLAFYESGRLKAKAMAFEDVRDIAPAASLPMEKIKKLKQGTEIDKVQAMIGAEGLEIMRMNLSDEDSSGVRRVLAWKDDDGEAVEMLFELDDNEWVLFAVVEIPVKPEQQMGNT